MAHITENRILENSTTTGTGALTLGGALPGYRTFAAKLAVSDTCWYMAQAVDGVGVPTGDWELGRGTYSSASVLTRTTVIASSNADAAVNFAAGNKQVGLVVLAPVNNTTLQDDWIRLLNASPLNIPQNSQSAAYTLVLLDSGKTIFHPSADTTARIWTIPANSSVAYPIGTVIQFINQNAAGVITIAITTDTMRWAPTGTTGSRTLAANGSATIEKVTATEWLITGVGLT